MSKKKFGTSANKQKGRRLQQNIVDIILQNFHTLNGDDVRSTPMGMKGADVLLSQEAKRLIPLSIECKNQEKRGYKGVYNAYKQAETHLKNLEPVAIIKENGEKPLAVVSPDYLFQLQSKVAFLTDNELKIKGNGHAIGVVPITMSTSVSSLYS